MCILKDSLLPLYDYLLSREINNCPTFCLNSATKAGKGQMGGSKPQTIKHFCYGMKQFIDVFGTLYICSEEDREIPSLIHHMFSR